MSDDKELDEIQAIFFEECTEGLATAEAGLSALANGDPSPDVIAGVFRAVHSIKGGAGAFGHDALLTFSHAFENVLDKVRAGDIPASAEIGQQLLSAFDILADHVSAAMGRCDIPQDGPVLAGLNALLAGGEQTGLNPAVPAPESAPPAPSTTGADEFGFTPVAIDMVDLDALDGDMGHDDIMESDAGSPWSVSFAPSRAAMANGAEPLLVIRELERMGARVTRADISKLPSLRELDPEQGYIHWELTIDGSVERQELDECFDFVAPDSLIEYRREGGVALDEAVTPPEAPMPEPAPDVSPVSDAPAPARLSVVPSAPTPTAVSTGEAKVLDAAAQTIRIDVTRLDMLLNLVGELVIRNSILNDRLAVEDQERVELPQLARLTREIQDNVMSLRAQPIRQAFSRVPRIVRELCAATAKQVNLEVHGDGSGGNSDANWQLSGARALAARNALIANGVPADRFTQIVAMAATRPVYPDQPDRPENRRITIVLLADKAALPGDGSMTF